MSMVGSVKTSTPTVNTPSTKPARPWETQGIKDTSADFAKIMDFAKSMAAPASAFGANTAKPAEATTLNGITFSFPAPSNTFSECGQEGPRGSGVGAKYTVRGGGLQERLPANQNMAQNQVKDFEPYFDSQEASDGHGKDNKTSQSAPIFNTWLSALDAWVESCKVSDTPIQLPSLPPEPEQAPAPVPAAAAPEASCSFASISAIGPGVRLCAAAPPRSAAGRSFDDTPKKASLDIAPDTPKNASLDVARGVGVRGAMSVPMRWALLALFGALLSAMWGQAHVLKSTIYSDLLSSNCNTVLTFQNFWRFSSQTPRRPRTPTWPL